MSALSCFGRTECVDVLLVATVVSLLALASAPDAWRRGFRAVREVGLSV